QPAVAGEEPRRLHGRSTGQVGPGDRDTVRQRAQAVADLESEVPQGIEQLLGHPLDVRGQLSVVDHHEVDVRRRMKLAAAVTARAMTTNGVAARPLVSLVMSFVNDFTRSSTTRAWACTDSWPEAPPACMTFTESSPSARAARKKSSRSRRRSSARSALASARRARRYSSGDMTRQSVAIRGEYCQIGRGLITMPRCDAFGVLRSTVLPRMTLAGHWRRSPPIWAGPTWSGCRPLRARPAPRLASARRCRARAAASTSPPTV